MSSDGNGPDTTWQNPRNANWGQSFEHAHHVDHDALPPASDLEDDEAFYAEMPAQAQEMGALDDEDNMADAFEPVSTTPFELLKQLGQYILPFAAPLLFAAFTCLFVLPLIAAKRAYIHPVGFWPVIIVILVVAVAQGIAVHYAGSNNSQWALVTLGGFFLFLLVGCFAIFGPVSTLIVVILIVAACVALMRFYVHTVTEGHVDIVYSFGKYSRTLYPGFNILLPWEKVAHKLNTGEKQWVCPLQKVQWSRDDDVVLRATISYQLLPEDAHIAATQVNQWEEILKELVISMIQTIATTFTPDDLSPLEPQRLQSRSLTYDAIEHGELRWERVNAYLYERLRDHVAMWGVQVNWVRIRDVGRAGHGETILEAEAASDISSLDINGSSPNMTKAVPRPPKAQKMKTKLAEEPTQAMPASPPIANSSSNPPQVLDEKVLIKAYKAVQNHEIVDPDIIRSIAEQFEEIARNPAARDTMSFDAEAAAQILRKWAHKFDDAKSNGPVRHPTDENLTRGG